MEKIADQLVIKEFSTKEEMLSAYGIIRQRYGEISTSDFEKQLDEMIKTSGFRMIVALFDGEIVGLSGYWIQRMFYCGRYVQMSSFIVDEEKRGFGIGKKIIDEIEKIARTNNCDQIVLDSYTENKKSHALYFREGFHIRGFHFMKDLV